MAVERLIVSGVVKNGVVVPETLLKSQNLPSTATAG